MNIERIGVSVHCQGHDPSNMSFRVFQWPNINQQIPNQTRVLVTTVNTIEGKNSLLYPRKKG